MQMKNYMADRFRNLSGSVLRRFAEEAAKRNLLAFTNGNPAPETFEIEELARLSSACLLKDRDKVLRYNMALGFPPLREALKERLAGKFGIDFERNDLVVTSGGTQGIDLICKIFLNGSESVVVEQPSYGSCFNIYRGYGKKLIGCPIKEDGIDLEELDRILKSNPDVKLIYTIPTFANPTGFTATMEKRRALYAMAQKYDVLILEDDPYSELRYKGEPTKPIKSFDSDGRVFYDGSLSKIIAPAFRLGFAVFDKAYTPQFNIAKQMTDTHSNLLAQYIAHQYLTGRDFEKHISFCQETYRHKSQLMIKLLKEKLHPSITMSSPEGGLYVMLFLPDNYDGLKFVEKGMDAGVACIPGCAFMLDPSRPTNSVRLCYSCVSDEQIEKGVGILGKVSHEIFD